MVINPSAKFQQNRFITVSVVLDTDEETQTHNRLGSSNNLCNSCFVLLERFDHDDASGLRRRGTYPKTQWILLGKVS